MRIRSLRMYAATLALCVVGGACASNPDGTSTGAATSPAGDPNTDKLAQIQARGTLVGYFEPDFYPQSFAVEDAERPADTGCADDQLTADEVTGYDVETTVLVADALGVEACFITPTWTEVTAGNWGDRLDIVYGSGSINAERMEVLWMTQPYYGVPVSYFVREDARYDEVTQLDGKRIGVCTSCSHELYLRGELEIPGVEIEPTVDAFLCADPVGEGQIEEGLDLRKLAPPAYTFYPSGFIDKGSGLSVEAFFDRVNRIIQGVQADGTLSALSQEWFGTDYASIGVAYDIEALGQEVA
jgi:polar amino acid transport system substrate-binding protein